VKDVMAQTNQSGVPSMVYADAPLGRKETVEVANQLAQRFSQDAPMRALAARILEGCQDVHGEGPPRIAKWVRENVMYLQETPSVEILQGPYTTLPAGLAIGSFVFEGTGAGDCDDLSILFATICRAAGLEGFVAGLAWEKDPDDFFHAVGYCNGNFYELSKDEPYGGMAGKQLIASTLPVGQVAYIYEPSFEKKGYRVRDGRSHISAHGSILKGTGSMGSSRGASMTRRLNPGEAAMARVRARQTGYQAGHPQATSHMTPGRAALARQKNARSMAASRRYQSMQQSPRARNRMRGPFDNIGISQEGGTTSIDLGVVSGEYSTETGFSLTQSQGALRVANHALVPVLVAVGVAGALDLSKGAAVVDAGTHPDSYGNAQIPGRKEFAYTQSRQEVNAVALVKYPSGFVYLDVAFSPRGTFGAIFVLPENQAREIYTRRTDTGVHTRRFDSVYPGADPQTPRYWYEWINNEGNFLRLSGLLRDLASALLEGATTGDWSGIKDVVIGPSAFTQEMAVMTTPSSESAPQLQERQQGGAASLLIPVAAIAGLLYFMG
jgi:hypothetical protein